LFALVSFLAGSFFAMEDAGFVAALVDVGAGGGEGLSIDGYGGAISIFGTGFGAGA
jgi:hypothetical protein